MGRTPDRRGPDDVRGGGSMNGSTVVRRRSPRALPVAALLAVAFATVALPGPANAALLAPRLMPQAGLPNLLGDLNGDGRPDDVSFVLGDCLCTQVFLANGYGTFDPGQVLASHSSFGAGAIADFDADSTPDVLL